MIVRQAGINALLDCDVAGEHVPGCTCSPCHVGAHWSVLPKGSSHNGDWRSRLPGGYTLVPAHQGLLPIQRRHQGHGCVTFSPGGQSVLSDFVKLSLSSHLNSMIPLALISI